MFKKVTHFLKKKDTHFVHAISKQFLLRTNWEILHLTDIFTQTAVVMVVTNNRYGLNVSSGSQASVSYLNFY